MCTQEAKRLSRMAEALVLLAPLLPLYGTGLAKSADGSDLV